MEGPRRLDKGEACLIISCCCCCILPPIIIMGLSFPLQLWGTSDVVQNSTLQLVFLMALGFLAAAGSVFLAAHCLLFGLGLDGASTEQMRKEARAARSEGLSYYGKGREARKQWYELAIAVPLWEALTPCLFVMFLTGIAAWGMLRGGAPLAATWGVCGTVGALAVCWCTFCWAFICSHAWDDPGLQEIKDAARDIDGTIERALHDGSLRLLSCAWLMRNRREKIRRRQELPEEAFVPSAEAAEMHKQGRVLVFSYGWLLPGMPDPYGLYMRAILRFLDSFPTNFGHPAESYGLFWDYGCLPQWPRTDEEEELFQRLLKLMGNLYGSMWRTTVLQHKLIPPGPYGVDGVELAQDPAYNSRAYEDRGWTNFEEGASLLAAGHRSAADKARLGRSHPKLIEISGALPNTIAVESSPAVKSLEEKIEKAHFTGSGDKDKVIAMLRDFNTLLIMAATDRASISESGVQGAAVVGRRDRVAPVLLS